MHSLHSSAVLYPSDLLAHPLMRFFNAPLVALEIPRMLNPWAIPSLRLISSMNR
jgi:hypothetical protein